MDSQVVRPAESADVDGGDRCGVPVIISWASAAAARDQRMAAEVCPVYMPPWVLLQ